MQTGSKTMVLATNDPVLIKQITSLLMEHNYSIIVVKSAIKSIVKILEQEIDFLILDSDLPNYHSINDLLNIIKKTRPRLPIVILSDDNSIETVREVTQHGILYYAIKPLEKDEMNNILEAVARHYKSQKIGSSIFY